MAHITIKETKMCKTKKRNWFLCSRIGNIYLVIMHEFRLMYLVCYIRGCHFQKLSATSNNVKYSNITQGVKNWYSYATVYILVIS